MKLSVLLEYLDGIGTMPQGWGTVVLVRNRRERMDSERAYEIVPVMGVRGDDGGKAVEIVAADDSGGKRVKELKAGETTARLKALAKTHASARIFVAHPGRDHVRVHGVSADADISALAFLEYFKGVEHEL